jgi:uncharacterized LabA/DUF88 family protein
MSINLAAHAEQRVAIFIDTQNLYHSAKSNFHANVNYEELIRVAVNGRRLVRAFAYVIKSDESSEEKFFEALEDIGIETRMKDLQVFHTGAKKADWDVGIAVDMIRLTEKVDVVVLASGDGDFIEVVRYCQSRGVRVEVMAFEKTTNAKIMDEVDHFTDLGDRKYNFLIGARRKTTRAAVGYGSRSAVLPSVPVGGVAPVSGLSAADKTSAITVEDMGKSYGGSSLSVANRAAQNANKPVPPQLFGRGTTAKRKIRPVVGLPGKPPERTLGDKTPGRESNRPSRPHPDNAFGNNPNVRP